MTNYQVRNGHTLDIKTTHSSPQVLSKLARKRSVADKVDFYCVPAETYENMRQGAEKLVELGIARSSRHSMSLDVDLSDL